MSALTYQEVADMLAAHGRRGLGLDDLLTRQEVRAVLRCDWPKVDAILAKVPAINTGRWALYRWRLVLAVVEPSTATDGPKPPRRKRARVDV